VSHGFDIVARNWRCPQGEIDIVATKGGVVVFIEVKTRTSSRFGEPFEAVGLDKQRRLRRLGAAWLRSNSRDRAYGAPFEVRFDVVSVTPGAIDVIESAF
jgi:putative endonuclease